METNRREPVPEPAEPPKTKRQEVPEPAEPPKAKRPQVNAEPPPSVPDKKRAPPQMARPQASADFLYLLEYCDCPSYHFQFSSMYHHHIMIHSFSKFGIIRMIIGHFGFCFRFLFISASTFTMELDGRPKYPRLQRLPRVRGFRPRRVRRVRQKKNQRSLQRHR